MILNGATLEADELPVFDVCIIGSGAVGFTLAKELWNQGELGVGKSVVVLESGIENQAWAPTPDSDRRFWDPVADSLNNGVINQEDPLKYLRPEFFNFSRTRCYGGSTNCWGGWIRPMDDYDFERGNWPISRVDLNNYYQRAMLLLNLDHFDLFDDASAWIEKKLIDTSEVMAFENSDLTKVGLKQVVAQKIDDNLSLNFQQKYGLMFETNYTNLTLIKNATALNLQCGAEQGPIVNEVECGALTTSSTVARTFSVKAKQFVLAMGGLEIPRFLMNNMDFNFRIRALKDYIGKYYTNHPKYINAAQLTVDFKSRYDDAAKYGMFYGGLSKQTHKVNSSIQAFIVPDKDTLIAKDINNFRVGLSVGEKEWPIKRVVWLCDLNFEQKAQAASHLELSPKESDKDVFGQKKMRLNWTFTNSGPKNDKNTLEQSLNLIAAWFNEFCPDYVDLRPVNWTGDFPPLDDVGDCKRNIRKMYTGDHHMGVCKMISKAGKSDGVVDQDCRVLGFKNLWICSTAVMPTGGWANCMLTLLALSIRLGERLKQTNP